MWDSARGLIAATVWVLLVWQSSCQYPILEGGMTATNSFRLRCTKTDGLDLPSTVYWYRNDTFVFKTYRWFSSSVSFFDKTFANSVQLTGTWRSHSVTVSSVHEGMSIWRCNNHENTSTWSNPVQLPGDTAGVTPFTLITPNPFGKSVGNVTLNVYPDKIFDENNFTLSCTLETGGQFNISNMVWIQNSEEIFVTFSKARYLVLDNSNTPAVMDVTQSYNQHNVTMEASPYVNGTEWTCRIPLFSTISNTVLIQVLELTGPQSVEDRTQLYTILGSTVGAVALTVVISVLVIRNRKKTEPTGIGQDSEPCYDDFEIIEPERSGQDGEPWYEDLEIIVVPSLRQQ